MNLMPKVTTPTGSSYTRNQAPPPPPPPDSTAASSGGEEKKRTWGSRAFNFLLITGLGAGLGWFITRKLDQWAKKGEDEEEEGGVDRNQPAFGMPQNMIMPQLLPIPWPMPGYGGGYGGYGPQPALPPANQTPAPQASRAARNDAEELTPEEVFEREFRKYELKRAREEAREAAAAQEEIRELEDMLASLEDDD